MKNLVNKTVEFLTGAKVHASHTAIKGNKSGGKADISSSYKHWQKEGGNGSVNDAN